MPSAQANPEPFAHFSRFVAEERQKYVGEDIAGNKHSYVPRPVLEEYWTNRNISKVLQAYSPTVPANVLAIKQQYIQVFSILVSIDGVRHLDKFTSHSLDDSKLPLKKRPPTEWPVDHHHGELFKKFDGEQWGFCPLNFVRHQLDDRDLPPELVLPIDSFEMVQQGDIAMVQKFVINDACNHLAESRCPSQRMFVLKTYHNNKSESLYDNERKALTMLMNIPSDNIVTYYGSFRQHGTFNLILEYADRGSLADLLNKLDPPSTAKDILQFWYSLFSTLHGLRRIHQWMEPDDDNHIRGIHEDIKPDNILLFKGRSDSPYDFTPAVADFGLFSHLRRSRTGSSEAKGLDNHGNQRYSAPECSSNTARMQKGPNWITGKADIFSFGALLSDCAAWVTGGDELRATYLRRRLSYHTKEKTFDNSGYDGCFHNGVERLPVVDNFHHEKIRRLCRPFDRVTPLILDLVENDMLLGKPIDRLNAQRLLAKFEIQIRSLDPLLYSSHIANVAPESVMPPLSDVSMVLAQPTIDVADASDTGADDIDTTSLTTSHDETSTRRPQLRITPSIGEPNSRFRDSGCGSSQTSVPPDGSLPVDQINPSPPTTPSIYSPLGGRDKDFNTEMLGEYRNAMKNGGDPDPLAQEVVEVILHNLSRRDQYFFIDDSTSMKDHAPVVKKTFLSLSWLAKQLDPDKLELSFASTPHHVIKAKKTQKLFKHVSRRKYQGDQTLMEKNFGTLVDNFLIPRLPWKVFGFDCNPWSRKRQMSVYIFTDGNWGNDPGVERPLQRLMNAIQKRDLDRNHISLHFIRFGSLPTGKKYLDFLDGYGRKDNWDIVDVKDISHPVMDIFMGPMSPEIDNRV